MSYVLCLGFNLKLYKKNPTVRVFINNSFIDQFEIKDIFTSEEPGRLHTKEFLNLHKQHSKLNNVPVSYVMYKNTKYIDPKTFLIFFEIDKSCLAKNTNNLKIEVFNDDNNYTNGFMTKSTYISLTTCMLIPKETLVNYEETIDQYESDLLELRRSQKSIKEIQSYYSSTSKKFYAFDLANEYCNGQKMIWYDNQNKKYQYIWLEWVGISGYTNLVFNKKNYSWDKKDILWCRIPTIDMYWLGYKYNYYENLRNNY